MATARRQGDPLRMSIAERNGGILRGTVVCGVTDSEDGRAALELAATLSARLGLRLVLAHVAEGVGPAGPNGDESLTAQQGRKGAARLLARIAAEYGIAGSADRRDAVGGRAESLARIAAEEAADLIVIGSRPQGRFRPGLRSTLAAELESETPVPVVIAPPRQPGRRGRGEVAAGSAAR
jgi:nucleotide-binding universal stress UspA family protein